MFGTVTKVNTCAGKIVCCFYNHENTEQLECVMRKLFHADAVSTCPLNRCETLLHVFFYKRCKKRERRTDITCWEKHGDIIFGDMRFSCCQNLFEQAHGIAH